MRLQRITVSPRLRRSMRAASRASATAAHGRTTGSSENPTPTSTIILRRGHAAAPRRPPRRLPDRELQRQIWRFQHSTQISPHLRKDLHFDVAVGYPRGILSGPASPPLLRESSLRAARTTDDIDRLAEMLERIAKGEYRGRYQQLSSGEFVPEGLAHDFGAHFALDTTGLPEAPAASGPCGV